MDTMNVMMGNRPAFAQQSSEVVPVELKSANTRQFLDFDVSKVQVLTLEQLEKTEKENDSYGNPIKGIYHFALIHKIQEMCAEHGYDAEIYDLFAANNRDKNTPGVSLLPAKEKQYGDRAIEAHILRRVFCNIRLRDFDAGEGKDAITTNMAVSFHQKGIQLGIGRNVKICHNQCLLSPEHYAATYRRNSIEKGYSLEEMLQIADNWLMNIRDIVALNDEKIEQMKQREILAEEMFKIIGMLTALRVASETKHREIRTPQTIPLNQAQIGRLTETMMLKYNQQGKVTVWDLYNGATDMYKSTQLDQPMILEQNRSMVEFIDSNLL